MKKNNSSPGNAALLFCIVLFAYSSTSFNVFQKEEVIVPEPTKDFSWIKQYGCIYDIFNQDQWEKNPDRSFDSLGVHLTKKNYHPVNACHYALFCYDEYYVTKNERFKKAFIAQVKYLRDSTKYKEFDCNKVGYPYNIIFHDLKPPWYSALAQSEAISVLVRYYALTKDKTILPLIVKVKNFMVAPASKDLGTMTKTPEGNLWYEEYPNSKQEKQVLNGFFLAIIALHDYISLFPGDAETKQLYDSSLIAAKSSIKFYDTGSWLKYNRGDGRLVANGYIKWQILEMKFLYNVTGDIFFKNQYMLWSTYAYEKPYETQGCKLTKYNFSVPVVYKNGIYQTERLPVNIKISALVSEYGGNPGDTAQIKKLFDGNYATTCSVKNSKTNSESNRDIYFKLKETVSFQLLKIKFRNVDTTILKNLFVYYQPSGKKGWKQIKSENMVRNGKVIDITVNETNAQGFKILFAGLKPVFEWLMEDVEIYGKPQPLQASAFMHYATELIKPNSPTLKFSASFNSVSDFIVYYKAAKDSSEFAKQTWTQERMFKTSEKQFDASASRFFKFLVVAKRENDDSGIKNVSVNQ